MTKKKIDKIVERVKELENQCQIGRDIEPAMEEMNQLLKGLSLEELFEVIVQLEEVFPNVEK